MASTKPTSTASTNTPTTATGGTTATSATLSSVPPVSTTINSTSTHTDSAIAESSSVIEATGLSRLSISSAEHEISTIDQTPLVLSAADRVFGIPELTERIFEYLSMKELLVSQRICRGARATVKETPRFQRRLFLEPGDFDDIHENEPTDDTRYVHEMVAVNRVDEWMEKVLPQLKPYEVVFNPLFVEQCLNHSGRSPLEFKAMPRVTAKFLRDDLVSTASCRQMYLTQPPLRVKTTSINVNSKACGGCHVGVHFLDEWSEGEKLGAGTTLGELIDDLRDSVGRKCKTIEARSDEESNWTFGLAEQPSEDESDEEEVEEEVEEEGDAEEESWLNLPD